MNNQWDNRYKSEEYIYGKEPNSFFQEKIENLKPGIMLLPGEGEGRNAVYASSLGWTVFAFDSSIEGKRKAMKLARERQVNIQYDVLFYQEFAVSAQKYDLIGLFFTHQPASESRQFHKKIQDVLKPGGVLLMEVFNKKQLENSSGGPKNIEFLYSKDELKEDFSELNIELLHETARVLSEGSFHQGRADVLQLVARKN